MILDMHCHLDRYPNPRKIAKEAEQAGVSIVAVTNLPSHFLQGKEPVSQLKNVRLSLGLHPLLAPHSDQEKALFAQQVQATTYIGEVGLDFSREGEHTKESQVDSFELVLKCISGKGKVVSMHSRKAEFEVLQCLERYSISGATFHWFSGTQKALREIIDAGHYVSINSAMLANPRARSLLSAVPKSSCLLETDGPYTMTGREKSRPVHLNHVVQELSTLWSMSIESVQRSVAENFRSMLQRITESNMLEG